MLANIRFEISISYVLQKSQLFCVYRELKQSGETSGARLKMESEAMGAWSLRPLRVILTPEVSTCAWKLILEKKTTGLATVWQSKACVQPYGRGTRLIRCHSNFSIPGPALVSPDREFPKHWYCFRLLDRWREGYSRSKMYFFAVFYRFTFLFHIIEYSVL